MNNRSRKYGFCAIRNEFAPRLSWRLTVLAIFFFVLGVSGCDNKRGETVVTLHARSLPALDPRILEVRAQTAATQSDLNFKWFADRGECDPQESSAPFTMFRFASGYKKDVITVEVWRGAKRLAQNRLEVNEKDAAAGGPSHCINIDITEVPPAADGGPDTRANIAGKVSGEITSDLRVLIYARDKGVWWIQPAIRTLHSIHPDNTWSSWTHTGQAYGVLIVRTDFVPLRTLDTLPQVRGNILACTVVDGAKKENARSE